jgi:glutamine---fructose-6-phosphate transaminase (isomerizing)
MCGIFGVLLREQAAMALPATTRLLRSLYMLSESRGKESAGLHLYLPAAGRAWTLKGARRASELMRSKQYAEIIDGPLRASFGPEAPKDAVALLAHSRLVTNGTAELSANNQPVRWGPVTMIHNGICVNVDELWQANSHLRRQAEVDTEVMAAIVADEMKASADPILATTKVFSRIRGAASIAWTHDRTTSVTLATNTGDLYYVDLLDHGTLVFASERYILENAILEGVPRNGAAPQVEWLSPGEGIVADLAAALPLQRFQMTRPNGTAHAGPMLPRDAAVHRDLAIEPDKPPIALTRKADESLLRYDEARMRSMRRCTRCVLPETFPFIAFDGAGVCNYCHSYRPRYGKMDPVESKRDFIRSLEKYRRSTSEPDVLVAFSGGRDSSYGLHLIKKEFGLTPVTFTYDWGMVTDLARRNIARICGQLGVQNILVSADIPLKRGNIRKNVSAWLKQPDLGVVPLFMAGDKHFFRVSNQLKSQTGIALDLWCANPLENTDFKSGLCGVSPDFHKSRVDYLSLGRKAQLVGYYGMRFLQNPAYLNASLRDTFGAFMSYYFEPRRDFYFIFDHFTWNEDEVNRVLLSEYDWELSPDSTSTWRIGDGTAPFYNYIYMTARGFTEFDTFRSNQIREGMVTRERALESILVENRPRTMSLRWYLETINLDFDTVIRRINQLDTLGLHR